MKNSKKQENQDMIASEIQNLKKKRNCSQLSVWPTSKKRPAACLRVPAWPAGPAANGWAGEAAQRRLPPGLKSARGSLMHRSRRSQNNG
jgi:hypothetical protein